MRRFLAMSMIALLAIVGISAITTAGAEAAHADGDGESPYALIEGTVSMAAPADWFSVDEDCRMAVIEWSGFNQVSLGSAIGFKNPVVESVLDILPMLLPGSQMDAVNQTFSLREEIRY